MTTPLRPPDDAPPPRDVRADIVGGWKWMQSIAEDRQRAAGPPPPPIEATEDEGRSRASLVGVRSTIRALLLYASALRGRGPRA